MLTADDVVRVLRLDNWRLVDGTKHLAFEHPTKPGKVSVDEKWDSLRMSGWTMRSVLAQASLTREEFEDLYWRVRGK